MVDVPAGHQGHFFPTRCRGYGLTSAVVLRHAVGHEVEHVVLLLVLDGVVVDVLLTPALAGEHYGGDEYGDKQYRGHRGCYDHQEGFGSVLFVVLAVRGFAGELTVGGLSGFGVWQGADE